MFASVKMAIIVSDNDLLPVRRQATIGTNVGLLSIGPLGANFRDFITEIKTFVFKKMRLKCRLENGGHFVWALLY